MYNSDSSHAWLAPSPEADSSDYGPQRSLFLLQGRDSEVPTQLQPRQPYPTQGPFTTQPHITLPQPLHGEYSDVQQKQQRTIMSSHNDRNSGDEEEEEEQMARVRARFERHTSRLDNMRALALEQRVKGDGRLRRQRKLEEEEECEDEDEGGRDDILGLGVPTLPPPPNLGKGKPFSPRRDFSYGSSPFKRKREGQESPEMRRASAPTLRQAVFQQAPILGRAATDGLNRVMIQGYRRSRGLQGLGLEDRRAPSNQKLHLGSHSQVLGSGPFEQSFDRPGHCQGSRQQPQSQDRPQELGLDGLGLFMPRPQYKVLSGQQPQSVNRRLRSVWEPGAAAFGSLLDFPPVSHIEDRRSQVDQLREAQNLAVRGGGSSDFLAAGCPQGRGSSANLVATPQVPGSSEKHKGDEVEWSSLAATRPLARYLSNCGHPSNLYDAPTSEVTIENPRTRLPPEPENNPWQTLPGFGDEYEIEDEGHGDNVIRISPNEQRRRPLGQQPFMHSFQKDDCGQVGMRYDFASALPPANRNNTLPNDHMLRRRATVAELRDKRIREREEPEQRPRHIRMNRTRFGVGDDAECDSGGVLSAKDQGFRVRQVGVGERGAIGVPSQPEGCDAWPKMRMTRESLNFNDEEDSGDEDDKDDEGIVRMAHTLQGSARRRQRQSSSAHSFGHATQRPDHETTSTYPRRSSSCPSRQVAGVNQSLLDLLNNQGREQRLPSLIEPTQAIRSIFERQ